MTPNKTAPGRKRHSFHLQVVLFSSKELPSSVNRTERHTTASRGIIPGERLEPDIPAPGVVGVRVGRRGFDHCAFFEVQPSEEPPGTSLVGSAFCGGISPPHALGVRNRSFGGILVASVSLVCTGKPWRSISRDDRFRLPALSSRRSHRSASGPVESSLIPFPLYLVVCFCHVSVESSEGRKQTEKEDGESIEEDHGR